MLVKSETIAFTWQVWLIATKLIYPWKNVDFLHLINYEPRWDWLLSKYSQLEKALLQVKTGIYRRLPALLNLCPLGFYYLRDSPDLSTA